MNPAMEIYKQIGEEIVRVQSDLDDYTKLLAYADPSDAPRLRDLANDARGFLAGLDRARSIAYRQAMSIKESA